MSQNKAARKENELGIMLGSWSYGALYFWRRKCLAIDRHAKWNRTSTLSLPAFTGIRSLSKNLNASVRNFGQLGQSISVEVAQGPICRGNKNPHQRHATCLCLETGEDYRREAVENRLALLRKWRRINGEFR
jgi:hypothetical protein